LGMGKKVDIRQRLHHYIETANEKKIKAIYVMVEDEISETYDHWQDEGFMSELKKREKSYLEGHAKPYSLNQTITRTEQAIRKLKRK